MCIKEKDVTYRTIQRKKKNILWLEGKNSIVNIIHKEKKENSNWITNYFEDETFSIIFPIAPWANDGTVTATNI
jgi:hypothetical protein